MMQKGNICCIQDLEINSTNPTTSAMSRRDMYAKTACAIFFPFRQHDMTPSTTSLYWTKYQVARDQNTFGEISFEILKNIEPRSTVFKTKSAEEPSKNRVCVIGGQGGARPPKFTLSVGQNFFRFPSISFDFLGSPAPYNTNPTRGDVRQVTTRASCWAND